MPCQRLPTQDGKGFGTVRQKCRDTSPSPTIRDVPWEHDRGEKPQGSGAQSVPCYVRIVGMGKKLMPKAICKTVCRRVVHWQVVKLPHTGRTDADSRTRAVWIGARTRKDHVRLRRPAARKETGAQDRQANPDPPANGKAPRTWCVCRWPNSVAWQPASPLTRAECAHLRAFTVAWTLLQRTQDNGEDDDDDGQDDG